jgi:hypothetical protein
VNPPPVNPQPANPPPVNPRPANPRPANPRPANPPPANPRPANPPPPDGAPAIERPRSAGDMKRGGRLRIDRVQLDTAGLTVRVRVTLAANGRPYVGEATGSTAATGVNRSVATATLAAAAAVADGRVAFDLDQLEMVLRGGTRAVLAIVLMTTESGSESLAGAAIVREDAHQAVMRATLDAVNRRIEPFLTA